MAREAARRRHELPRQRRLHRRAWPSGGRARPGRGAHARRPHPEALDEFEALRSGVRATGSPELESRALAGEARARAINGEVREAIPMLERARSLTEGPSFSDIERAEVVYELGVARYKLSSVSTALALFNAALELCERSNLPSDALRSKLFEARSRCYRRQRDFEAAKEDVERGARARGIGARSAGARTRALPGVAGRRARGSLRSRGTTPSGRSRSTRSSPSSGTSARP